ncbi:MAG: dienelactone hydrolase family protein, partial [Sphingomonadales bacterium]
MAAAGLSACAPMAGEGGTAPASSGIVERAVSFPTPDGTLDGEFYARKGRKAPGVILWPDIAGIRPAKRQMARRLAEAGYSVLLANPYYRDVKGQQFADFAAFAGAGGFEKVGPWRAKLSVASLTRDDRAAADWLAAQDEVDAKRGMGTQGYCMTGSTGLVGPAA